MRKGLAVGAIPLLLLGLGGCQIGARISIPKCVKPESESSEAARRLEHMPAAPPPVPLEPRLSLPEKVLWADGVSLEEALLLAQQVDPRLLESRPRSANGAEAYPRGEAPPEASPAASAEEVAAELDRLSKKDRERRVYSEVRIGYYAALLAARRQLLGRRSTERMRGLFDLAEARARRGGLPACELALVRRAYQQFVREKVGADAHLHAEMGSFAARLAVPEQADAVLSSDFPERLEAPLCSDLIVRALASRGDLRAARLRLLDAETGRPGQPPEGNAAAPGRPEAAWAATGPAAGAALQVTWRLGGANLPAAEVRRAAFAGEVAGLEKTIRKEVQAAHGRLVQALAKVELYELELLPRLDRQGPDRLEVALRDGPPNVGRVLRDAADEMRLRSEHLDALFGYAQARVALDETVGGVGAAGPAALR